MDLDPTTRAEFIGQHGLDYSKWGHSIGDPYARVAVTGASAVMTKASRMCRIMREGVLNVARRLCL